MSVIALFLASVFLFLSTPLVPKDPPVIDTAAEIYYGTPEIDGVIDSEYYDSHRYLLPKGKNLNYPGEAAAPYMEETEGVVYYLYDDEYLYACAVVTDATIMSMGEEWRESTTWPWNDDGAELYYAFSPDNMFAIHTDAEGIRAVRDTKIWGDNHSSARIYEDVPKTDYAVGYPDDTTYVVEIRVGIQGLRAGDTIGLFLEIDDRYAMGKETNKCVGALFPKNRNPYSPAYLATLSDKAAAAAPDEQEMAAMGYMIHRFFGILSAKETK